MKQPDHDIIWDNEKQKFVLKSRNSWFQLAFSNKEDLIKYIKENNVVACLDNIKEIKK